MSNSLIKDKSFKFSFQVIEVYNYLKLTQNEFVLSKQLLRSGTSIGANVKEALKGQSRRDFLSKINIALKEAEETEYWLELLIFSKYLNSNNENSVLRNCRELCKILNSIVSTTKSNKISFK